MLAPTGSTTPGLEPGALQRIEKIETVLRLGRERFQERRRPFTGLPGLLGAECRCPGVALPLIMRIVPVRAAAAVNDENIA
jgi:hypothetical protein